MSRKIHATYCTIITEDYLHFAETIFSSLRTFNNECQFQVLIVDATKKPSKNFKIHLKTEVQQCLPQEYKQIKKYELDLKSSFRWAFKPLFLKYLIEKERIEKVIYLDPDIFFYNSPDFLFDYLEESNVLLTPHWRSKDPFVDKNNFDLIFKGGIYNAGFFGCNKYSIPILDWWLKVCSYKMVKSNGMYVDQAFLNLMPVYFSEQVILIQHKGCNVAGWNQVECKRSVKNEKVLINEQYPIIFIHFTPGTIFEINTGNDKLLAPYLKEYEETLRRFLPQFAFEDDKLNKNSESGLFGIFRKWGFKLNG